MDYLLERLVILEVQIPTSGEQISQLTHIQETMEKFQPLVPILENYTVGDCKLEKSPEREVIIHNLNQLRIHLDYMDEIMRLASSLDDFNELYPHLSLDDKYHSILQRFNDVNTKFHSCVIKFIQILQRSVSLRYKQELVMVESTT